MDFVVVRGAGSRMGEGFLGKGGGESEEGLAATP